jgi:hypothetical protein
LLEVQYYTEEWLNEFNDRNKHWRN